MATDKHDELVERAKSAINAVFADDSVDRRQTRDSLMDLRDEIEVLLGAL